MRVRGEPILECALGGGGLAKGSQRPAAIGEEACPDRAGQFLGKISGVVENLLIALRNEFGLRPEFDDLSLVNPVFARARQQPERRIAAFEVDIYLHRKQPRRDVPVAARGRRQA